MVLFFTTSVWLVINRDVVRARLAGDHLSAITRPGVGTGAIHAAEKAADGSLIFLREVEPTLGDVFLALAADQ
jgi:hypothetical protein